MRVKLDENIPVQLVAILRKLGHDADSVRDEKLGGGTDEQVWQATQREERFLITQDLDFSDVRRFSPGTHAGVLLIRLRAPERQVLVDRVEKLFQNEFVNRWAGCFVVLTERKIRVKWPPENL